MADPSDLIAKLREVFLDKGMSIFRSGLTKPVYVVCVQGVQGAGFTCEEGKKYELVIDLGSMYVLKMPDGQEAIVAKQSFVVAADN